MARIVVFGKYYPPGLGGTESNTRDVAEALAARHDVTAIVFNHEPGYREERINGVRVVRCAVNATVKSQAVSLQYWRMLRLRDCDLIHFHAPNLFATVALLLQMSITRRDVPVIITHHSDVHGRRLLRAILMPFYFQLARRARHVVVASLKTARVSTDLPAGARLTVIPLGIDPGCYVLTPAIRTEAAQWRATLCGDARTIGFIGRHVRYKGLDVLVRALAAMPDVHALVAGDGPVRNAATLLAQQLGLERRMHFLGNVDDHDKLKVLAASDVFAFPSTETTEAFGIVQLEAMAAGIPVVASDIPTGVTDIAIHGQTALLVPPGDDLALAEALGRMLDDRALRDRLTANALARVTTVFSKQRSLDQFRALVDADLA